MGALVAVALDLEEDASPVVELRNHFLEHPVAVAGASAVRAQLREGDARLEFQAAVRADNDLPVLLAPGGPEAAGVFHHRAVAPAQVAVLVLLELCVDPLRHFVEVGGDHAQSLDALPLRLVRENWGGELGVRLVVVAGDGEGEEGEGEDRLVEHYTPLQTVQVGLAFWFVKRE